MSILVVCPSCRKSFQVSDKFAGVTGSCPKCKGKITVPTKAQEVQVHAPAQFAGGGRSVSGELVTKPIARKMTKLEPVRAAVVAGAALLVLVVAWAGGKAEWFGLPVVCGIGLLLISPPLVVAAYAFLRNDELEPFLQKELYVRAGICSLAYVVLWGVFAYVSNMGLLTGELWSWFFVAPPFLLIGALAAYGSLDLEFGSGFFHYCFYLLVTVLLRAVAGLGWVWDVGAGQK
jgi:hypothetical protein